MRVIATLALLWLTIVPGWAPSPAGGGHSVARTPIRHVVVIRQFAFHPDTLEVMAGDTVEWVNEDIVPHSITARDSSWMSGIIGTGESWHLEVPEGGAGRYFCGLHPTMVGELTSSASTLPKTSITRSKGS